MRGQLIGQHQPSGGYAALRSARQFQQTAQELCRPFDSFRSASRLTARPAREGRTHARKAVPTAVRLVNTHSDCSRQTQTNNIPWQKHRQRLSALSANAGHKQVSADQVDLVVLRLSTDLTLVLSIKTLLPAGHCGDIWRNDHGGRAQGHILSAGSSLRSKPA